VRCDGAVCKICSCPLPSELWACVENGQGSSGSARGQEERAGQANEAGLSDIGSNVDAKSGSQANTKECMVEKDGWLIGEWKKQRIESS
jgi:hypothetical protein